MAEERASVGVFRAVAVIVAVALALLWFVFVRGTPTRARPADRAYAASTSDGTERRTRSSKPETPEQYVPRGATRFVRRLVLGDRLMLLPPDPDMDVATEAMRLAEPHLLRADGWELPEDPLDRLAKLIRPRRDTGALHLSHAGGHGPLGDAIPVRIWTMEGDFDASDSKNGCRFLRHLERVAGATLQGGADVLATPGYGRDVFPEQADYSHCLGVFFLADRYIALRPNMLPRTRFETLKHELVHAYCRGFTKNFLKSRFISEGLAEYLRHWRSADRGFDIPVRRLAHNLARLHSFFELCRKHDLRIDALRPARLLELTPRQFYRLGYMGYMIAEATMAYVGSDVIERAFRKKMARPIADAVRHMSWPALVQFVAEGATGGDPRRALVIHDSHHTKKRGASEPTLKAQDVLRFLGADGPELPPDSFTVNPGVDPFDKRTVESVETALRGDGPLLICVDRSVAMDRRRVDGRTGRDVVRQYRKTLAGSFPKGVGLGTEVAYVRWRDVARVAPYDISKLPAWLAKNKLHGASLVILVASEGDPFTFQRLLAAILRQRIKPRAVLVVDLGETSKHAEDITAAFAMRNNYRGLVAYTRPQ